MKTRKSATPEAIRAAMLKAMPGTRSEVVSRTGFGKTTVFRWLEVLRCERLIYVSAWHRNNSQGVLLPTFRLGNNPDVVPNVRLMTEAEKAAREEVRAQNATDEDFSNRRKMALSYADKAAKTPQHWLSSLGL